MTQDANTAESTTPATDTTDLSEGVDVNPDIDVESPSQPVQFPTGDVEQVEPDYEIFIAVDHREFFPAPDETAITRLELTGVGDVDGDAARTAIEDGFQNFVADGGSVDGLIEKVYTRTVGGETSLCVVVRSPEDEGPARSRFALALDESLRSHFTDR